MFLRVSVLLVASSILFVQVFGDSNSSSPTVTIELPSSAFESTKSSDISPSTVTEQQPTPTTPTPTTTPTTTTTTNIDLKHLLDEFNKLQKETSSNGGSSSGGGECDGIDWYNENKCTDKTTCEAYLAKYSKQIKCLGNKPENVTSHKMVENLEVAGMKIAEDRMEKIKKGALNNETSNFVMESYVMISGVADDKYINSTKDEFLRIPNYSDPSFLTGDWETLRDSIDIPIKELMMRATPFWPYVATVQSNLVEDRPLTMTEIETDYNEIIKESEPSDLYLDGTELRSRKKPAKIFINSNVITITFKRSFKDLKDPVLITLRHKKTDGLAHPVCVYLDTITSIWSKKGCEVKDTNSSHTICACNHLSMFALAMKEKKIEDLSKRETLVTVAIVFGSISFILLIAGAICIFVVGYYSVDNMKIALNIDLSLILCHLFFFIGLSNEASKYLASPATCEVVAPFVHMFELTALSFLLMEGLHYRSLFGSVFNKKNTRTFYIYAALGWGIPVAFGSAVAGYTYQHHGSPYRNEFCWMSVYGADAWYFGTPVLVLSLMNLIVRATVLKGVMAWKGDPDDINIERTKVRLITSMILLPVIILTWLLGVVATNHSEDKTYHYFFVIFHALQGILVFIFYCARNTEMWAYYKDKKTKETEEKNAVYHFQYVP